MWVVMCVCVGCNVCVWDVGCNGPLAQQSNLYLMQTTRREREGWVERWREREGERDGCVREREREMDV